MPCGLCNLDVVNRAWLMPSACTRIATCTCMLWQLPGMNLIMSDEVTITALWQALPHFPSAEIEDPFHEQVPFTGLRKQFLPNGLAWGHSLQQDPAMQTPVEDQKLLQVAVVGVPNAGKSSLVNALVGSKVSEDCAACAHGDQAALQGRFEAEPVIMFCNACNVTRVPCAWLLHAALTWKACVTGCSGQLQDQYNHSCRAGCLH